MFKKILFVCVGNICRSPAAEYWARAQFQKKNLTDIEISSAGLHAMVSKPIAPEMKLILDHLEVDASPHQAKQVDEKCVANSEIIFVMENWQKQELSFAFPSSRGKIFSLGKWNDEEIEDPYRKDQVAFDHTFGVIQKNWELWQKKLWNC